MKKIKYANRLYLSLIAIYILIILALSFLPIKISLIQSSLLPQCIILIPGLIYFVFTRTQITDVIPFKRIKISTCFILLLFTILILPTMTLLNAISMFYSTNTTSTVMDEMGKLPYLLNLFLVAILPGFSEEFTYRGIFYHTYKKRGILLGAITSGILFGLMHMNFNQFTYAFVLGIVFALLIEATGSILAPMLVHFFINANSVTLLKLLNMLINYMDSHPEIFGDAGSIIESSSQAYSFEELLTVLATYLVMAAFTIPLAAYVYVWISRRSGRLEHVKAIFFKKDRARQLNVSFDEAYPENEQKDKERIITPALVLAVLLCIAYMVLVEIW